MVNEGDSVMIEQLIASVEEAESNGDYLLAFDRARQGLEINSLNVRLKYLAVRALARAGSPLRAERLYHEYGLNSVDDVDIASLEARIAKDQYLLSNRDRAAAASSAQKYQRVFERTRNYYPGINAATMWFLAGDEVKSAELARRVWELCDSENAANALDQYFLDATVAEAALLLDDDEQARRSLESASRVQGDHFDMIAATRKQLLMICEAKGIDSAHLDILKNQRVIFYSGHIIALPDGVGRFAAESEPLVAGRIKEALTEADVGFGFGSLASGGDILFAEALLACGKELHIVLPFECDEFKAVSVAPAGEQWCKRFDVCLGRATSITYATRGAYLGDVKLFRYAARVAMGLARIRADGLESDLTMVAVWDRKPATGEAGTGADVKYWLECGLDLRVVDCGPPASGARVSEPATEFPPHEREILPVLFGDVKGFSGLEEEHLLVFNDDFMGALGETIGDFRDKVLFKNTWGDAVHVVFDNLVDAADCALAMQEKLAGIDYDVLGLPGDVGMRISLHVGPVFAGVDRVTTKETYFGHTLTRAARMEPITPVGEVYVTEQFAALIAMEQGDQIRCTYVGSVPLAKDYGVLRMYSLIRLPGADDDPSR